MFDYLVKQYFDVCLFSHAFVIIQRKSSSAIDTHKIGKLGGAKYVKRFGLRSELESHEEAQPLNDLKFEIEMRLICHGCKLRINYPKRLPLILTPMTDVNY